MKTLLLLAFPLLATPAALAGFDADGNGLSDLFEFIYFKAAADPGADPDRDGFITADGAIWGTDPTSRASMVRGATVYVDGADLVLAWSAAAGKWYRLQITADLQTWTTVAEGNMASHREPLAADGLRFWRLQVFGNTPDSDGNGFDDWEEALWKSKYGDVLGKTDLDSDGLPDAAEFTSSRQPERKDHPAVGSAVTMQLKDATDRELIGGE